MYSASKSWIDIDAQALTHNLESVRALVSPSNVMAVVKANAYGHGLEQVATSLGSRPDWYGVDSFEEAEVLRGCGIKKPILIMGYIPESQLHHAIELDCVILVSSEDALRSLEVHAKALHKPAHVHCKWDTGLHRQGFNCALAEQIARTWKNHPHVLIEGHATHFSGSENPKHDTFTQEQQRQLDACASLFTQHGYSVAQTHSACSAALFAHPNTRGTIVRLGISLYGYYPSEEVHHATQAVLKPVMTWNTHVVQIKRIPKGETVGYDRAFTATRESVVGLLPIGYWDGYDRSFSETAHVFIRDVKAPILGRVCMNMAFVDLTDVPDACVGDVCTLLDSRITADELATHAKTISYEILTRINPLIPRIVRNA